MRVPGHQTSLLVTGLRAETQYHFQVAAVNLAGRGRWSAGIVARTGRITSRPAPPIAAAKIIPSSTCDDVILRFDSLRAGCAADSGLVVEMSPASAHPTWTIAADGVTDEFHVHNLEAQRAYMFRTRARNSVGLSGPGPMSTVTVPGDTESVLSRAPQVDVLSS